MSVNVPSLSQWTPCSYHYTIPNTQYILIIFSLGSVVPLGLLQLAYHVTLVAVQRQIDQGHGDESPDGFNIQHQAISAIAVRYTRNTSPHPPTNRDLIELFHSLLFITADKDYPKPNPPFSRETRFGLAYVNGPSIDPVANGVAELVETNGGSFASS